MHSMSMLGMARLKKEAQSCRHSRDHPAAGTESRHQHTGHRAAAQPETKTHDPSWQTLPPQVASCSFLEKMYRKRSSARVNWEIIFASAEPLGRTAPVRAGACPSREDTCGGPKCILFPEQPHCPSQTVLSKGAQGRDPTGTHGQV